MFDLNARNVPYILGLDDKDGSNLELVFTKDELWKNLPDLAYECVKFWMRWHPIGFKEESLYREPFFAHLQYNPYNPFLGPMVTELHDPYAKRDDQVFKLPEVYKNNGNSKFINDTINDLIL